jgi:hypothetical protein
MLALVPQVFLTHVLPPFPWSISSIYMLRCCDCIIGFAADGPMATRNLFQPHGLIYDQVSNMMYFTELGGNRIRQLSPSTALLFT